MKKKAKIMALVLALMLVFQYFNYAGVLKQVEAAATNEVQFVSMDMGFINESDGSKGDLIATVNAAGSNTDPETRIDASKILYLHYNWSISDGHTIQTGDTYTFQLPEQLKLYEPLENKSLGDAGTFSAYTDGRVVMTFDESIAGSTGTVGFLEFWTYIDSSKTNNETEINIDFNIGDPITIKLQPKVTESISKTGQAKPQSYNAKAIDWTVDVNKSLQNITNAVMSDTILSGQEYVADSVVVYPLDVKADGTIVPDSTPYPPTSINVDAGTLKVNLGTIDGAYRIQFSTKITDYNKLSFDNKASLAGTGFPAVESNLASVNVTRGKLLEKSNVYTQDTQKIKWTIKYNFGETDIAAPSFEDLFSKNHILVDGAAGVKVYTVSDLASAAKGALVDSSEFVVTPINNVDEKNGFMLTFNNPIASSAYIIEYETTPDPNFRIYDDAQSIPNEIKVGGEVITSSTASVKHRFYSKSNSGVNYADRTINWTIKVNEDKYDIENTTLEDTFPDGLKMVDESLKVLKNGTNEADLTPYNVTYKGGSSETTEGFTLNLPDGPNTYTITYKTYYDYQDGSYATTKSNYNNNGELAWTDLVYDTNTIEKSFESTFFPGDKTVDNGFKLGSYDTATKTITWGIGINYNSKTMESAVVRDKLLSIQKLNPASIKVYKMIINSNGSHQISDEISDFSKVLPNESNNNTLTISFNNTINQPYYIEFVTSVDDSVIGSGEAAISNVAEFTATNYSLKQLDAIVSIPKAGEYISKEGTQNADDRYRMDWTLYINRGQSTVSSAKVIDTPSNNQVVVKDSVKLYATNIDSSGNVTKKGDALTTGFKVVYNEGIETPTFEIQFLQDISKAYILEYSTIIDAEWGTSLDITNTAEFVASGGISKQLDDPVQKRILLSGGNGDSMIYSGSLNVLKLDADSLDPSNNQLAGAVFKVTRLNGTQVGASKTTPANGELTFSGLRYGNYLLVEESAPTGYVPIAAPIPFTINNSVIPVELTVSNERQTSNLDITKVDKGDNTKLLPGAKFVLYREDKSVVGEVTTGADETVAATFGKASFSNLPFGKYILKETQTPAGYLLDGNGEYPIEIKPGENTAITIQNIKYVYIPGVPTPTPTPTPTPSPTPSEEPEESATPTPTPKPTPTPTPGASETPKPTPTPAGEKTTEDTPVVGEVDVPKGGVTEVGTPPSNGDITITPDGKWKYTPKPGFIGKDRFSVIVVNEDGEEEEIWIEIDVEPVPEGTVEDGTPDLNNLPKTGQADYTLLYLLGAALVGGGLLLRWSGKRKTS